MAELPRRQRAVVAGGRHLVREVVTYVLEHQADVMPASAGEAVDLAVLLDPCTEDWLSVRATATIVLSSRRLDPEEVADVIVRGADAVLDFDAEPQELVAAVRVVSAGGTVVDPAVARAVAERARSVASECAVRLSGRELEILRSIERGESTKQTARALGIAAKTVENLQGRLFRKLAVRNRAQAVARGYDLGVLQTRAG